MTVKCLTCYKIYENVFTFPGGAQWKIYTNIDNLSSWGVGEGGRGDYTTSDGKAGRLKQFSYNDRLYLIDRKIIKTCPCKGVYVESTED